MLERYVCFMYKPKLNVFECLFYLSLLPFLCKSKQNINEYYVEKQVCPLIQISGM